MNNFSTASVAVEKLIDRPGKLYAIGPEDKPVIVLVFDDPSQEPLIDFRSFSPNAKAYEYTARAAALAGKCRMVKLGKNMVLLVPLPWFFDRMFSVSERGGQQDQVMAIRRKFEAEIARDDRRLIS